jgi:hypothetical protein
MDMRFGTWNVRSMYRAGSLRVVGDEISKYKLDILGVQEVRWDGGGTERAGEYTVACTPLIRRVLVRMIGFIIGWLHTHS